jgi:hypothetical protein
LRALSPQAAAGAPDERHVIVMGTPEQQFKAQYRIHELMLSDDALREGAHRSASGGVAAGIGGFPGAGAGAGGPRRMKVHFHVPVNVLGSVIGKGGVKINEIATTSGEISAPTNVSCRLNSCCSRCCLSSANFLAVADADCH